MSDWPIIAKQIRNAADVLALHIQEDVPVGSMREAQTKLAWHHLVRAHSLLCTGEMNTETMRWALDHAAKIEDNTEPSP